MFSSRNNRQVVLPGAHLIGYKETQTRDTDVSYPKDLGKEPSEGGRKTLRPQRKRLGAPLVPREKLT